MTKSELIALVAEKTGKTNKAAKADVELIFDTILNTLAEGESVTIAGFGNFDIKTRAARKGVNPATKAVIDIPETKTVSFKATKVLREKLN